MSGLGEYACYKLSYYMLSHKKFGRYSELVKVSTDVTEFEEWRAKNLEVALNHVLRESLIGKTILDFGCGGGRLSSLLRQKGAAQVIGVDINPNSLDVANRHNPDKSSIFFKLSSVSTIPMPDESVDRVACIGVLEHIMDIDAVLSEWHRILRPGGKVLIDWQAWYHPEGSHLESVIPIPYAQCLFSERTLARTAHRIRHSDAYAPKFWNRRMTRSVSQQNLPSQYCASFLNKMSISCFNRKLKQMNRFQVQYYGCHPPSWLPRVRPLLSFPIFREFLSSATNYILVKP